MEVNPIASQDVNAIVTSARVGSVVKEKAPATTVDAETVQIEDKESLSREDMEKITDKMTKFMASMNTDIEFSLHEGTNRLIVKVVDKKTDKVLKEFPPHQLLDTMAAISEYIGGLLDKKV